MRNLTQEFEALLKGRSILDLTGNEAALAVDMLTEIAKSKPLKALTKVEFQSLIEELSEIVGINMFKGDLPENWEKEALNKLECSPERKWGWSLVSILDQFLHDVDMWDCLDADERKVVAKAILEHLGKEQ
jgi:hypothetical protein